MSLIDALPRIVGSDRGAHVARGAAVLFARFLRGRRRDARWRSSSRVGRAGRRDRADRRRKAGVAVNTRGGGMSYTKGHVPVRPDTIILDATGLNRVHRGQHRRSLRHARDRRALGRPARGAARHRLPRALSRHAVRQFRDRRRRPVAERDRHGAHDARRARARPRGRAGRRPDPAHRIVGDARTPRRSIATTVPISPACSCATPARSASRPRCICCSSRGRRCRSAA